ncbi:putative RNA methyltransferase [Neptuniibacter halophilus]|uniref:putative RNA methyltransferase n=1 Tax=Neptuniibacter halophilus TaxID=651666 RepID=UPI00257224DF|nr:methyltransferase domain-containing protein [Neptuniibacter halophilus]
MQLTCPVCQALLKQQETNLRCDNNHSFDAARQGYWNLLLAHKKRSRDPGDNPAMVQARRAFLDQGFYQPLSDQINQLALSSLGDTEHPSVLDMGCGEGYYTDRLQQALLEAQVDAELYGLDISKHAVKAACQRSKQIHWLVASGASTPLPDNSLSLQLVLFSRLMPEALAKPMQPGAALLVAWPGEQHLIELRKLIYQEIRESQFDPVSTLAEQFSLQSIQPVSYSFTLNSPEQISTLLQMTPHGQRLKQEARERICQLPELELTLDVNLGLFLRR